MTRDSTTMLLAKLAPGRHLSIGVLGLLLALKFCVLLVISLVNKLQFLPTKHTWGIRSTWHRAILR